MEYDFALILWAAYVAAFIVILGRIILRPQREPASRLAWLIATIAVPVVGILAYLLLGEARISAKRRARYAAIEAHLPHPHDNAHVRRRLARSAWAAPFALAETVNALPPTAGNRAHLAADSNAAIREMVEDIDNAKSTVHLCFYIWLADNNGFRIKDALVRAARRGVKVRVLADALGSRGFIRSAYWIELENAGIDARIALPIGGLIWTLIRGRFDLRNHRKQLIVDNRIAWCGSQNLADPEFRIKSKYAPWVDIMTRWEGPVVQGCQFVFAADWESEGGDDIGDLLQDDAEPAAAADPGIAAQVIATGPNVRYAAMTACFTALIHSARRELIVTTPYFVPDEQLLFALLDCARRGVATVMIVPRRNDSRIVAGASRSYYADLVDAGVKLYEYRPGLLHAKTMVVDGEVALIGSANLDRRSFELNFENNILLRDKAFATELRARQEVYRADATPVGAADVASVGIVRRLWQNLVATVSPLL
ncbi:cardiolipin synthase [Sphingopyxis terrae]|uniref:Cardiolipin synthase n=1 Tax=Sphingopyxis terrae subsp. ummariensis TaxID=429001 RepID=A0A1Y6EHP9_9SPHN|nr:cardiolipin synthase [Sphingopyxis terrae]PCF93294.1 cardiolipin synthase [Sphingopyxis terrae subsp. ummariensis]SMQ62145.1 cardiolipin synthase [Sphingopyxis terrae subsp. ummariensis]